MRIIYLIGFFLSLTYIVGAQEVQWASTVLEKSSQNTSRKGSAQQVLGAPSVFPQGGTSSCAWKPSVKTDKEFVKVGFAKPMKVSQVVIAENFNPGCVTQLLGYDAKGKEYKLAKFKAELISGSRLWHVKLDVPTAFDLVALKVVVDNEKYFGKPQIDAIGIMDNDAKVEITIKKAPGLVYVSKAENLGQNVNSACGELMPLISPDGNTLYFTRDQNCPQSYGGQDIWFSTYQKDTKKWSRAENIGLPVNSKIHDAMYSITPDGNKALISGKRYPTGITKQGYSIAERSGTNWQSPVGIEVVNFYNDNEYVEASLAQNGKAILTTIENDDSFGERDIYVSFLQEDGTWSKPLNLGNVVNTAADETSPFLASDNATVYYSTAGKSGYGSNDIFMTKRLDDTWQNWSEPMNLGDEINTANWDAYYTVPAAADYAYFVSGENSFGGEDIFRIQLPQAAKPNPVVLVKGKVYNAKTKQPIAADIAYQILPEGTEAGIASSNSANGAYKIVLPYGKNYGFLAESKGYIGINQNLDLSTIKAYAEVERDLYLVPIEVGQTVRLNNIFFDFGKASLRNESAPEMDRVVKFLSENPKVNIEISGHTDNVGDSEANVKLSTNRAKSVYDYLLSKGVSAARITSNGFGEKVPVSTNDTDEGRQLNRRVEFKILTM